MTKLHFLLMALIIAALLLSINKAKAAEEKAAPSSSNAEVLGQKHKQEQKAQQDAQTLFEESLRQLMPLTDGQIQEYRTHSDKRERALLPTSPELSSRTVRVSLEPGKKPVKVLTTANIATSLVFHDATGQPWPVTSVTNGGPNFFQILRPELPDGNLLNVMPIHTTGGYGTSTIVVTLQDKDVPLVIRLEADSVRSPKRKADALVLFQLAHNGPKASIPVTRDIQETVTSDMLAFLDQVPPKKAVRLTTSPKQETLTVWKLETKHYIRTSHTLMWPAWSAVVNGAGNVKCYEVPITSRITLSIGGVMQSFTLNEATQNHSSLLLPSVNAVCSKNARCKEVEKFKVRRVLDIHKQFEFLPLTPQIAFFQRTAKVARP